jgi:hypothetical protein
MMESTNHKCALCCCGCPAETLASTTLLLLLLILLLLLLLTIAQTEVNLCKAQAELLVQLDTIGAQVNVIHDKAASAFLCVSRCIFVGDHFQVI